MPTSSNPTTNQRSIEPGSGESPPSNRTAPDLVIALGDPAGIGAEVVLKALAEPRPEQQRLVLVGCRRWLETTYQQLRSRSDAPLADPADLEVLDVPLEAPVQPGESSAAAGAASFAWLSRATELVLEGRGRALVTAPIAKASWHAAGHPYPGQTERLAELAGVPEAAMLFTARPAAGPWRLNTLLATTHIPLREVPQRLGPELIHRRLDVLLAFCRRFSSRPRLAVAGLNPHAGEAGRLGSEECDWLNDTLADWQAAHPDVQLEGPLPPDTCWISAAAAWHAATAGDGTAAASGAADGYLALYHDQGLIPVKLLAFDAAVNTSLGLPFLRTSPDHGTAFAIAGRGIARPASMAAALATAWELG
jgi:4-hydroxythreonine-4-phosphate dehydrogenase